ncbi:MAG: hypothetical protein AAGF58_09885 [Pseudomonadota bacterium]
MEPISTAIIAAIAAGAVSGATEVGKAAIVDAYKGLKALIVRSFGADSDAAEAIEKLEQQPDRDDRRATVATELALAGAGDNPAIVEAAEALLKQIQAQPGGGQTVQNAQGYGIAQASGNSTATVNIGRKNN